VALALDGHKPTLIRATPCVIPLPDGREFRTVIYSIPPSELPDVVYLESLL